VARLRRGSNLTTQGRSPRRKSSWDLGPGGTADTTFTASGSAIIASGAISILDGTTIVRIRGEVLAYLEATASAGEGFRVGVGILLSEVEAFVAGISALPTPLAQMDHEDWVWHTIFGLRSAGIVSGGAATDRDVAGAVTQARRIEIDSHAMRKFDAGKILVLVAEVVEIGAASMNIGGETRMLGLLA